MHTSAVILEGPRQLTLREIGLKDPTEGDVVVCVHHSGISTGTEKLLWSGSMPPFPGLGYPLVPGYEAVGEIVDAPKGSGHKIGDFVFVPGSNSFVDAKGLFGGSAGTLVTQASRVSKIDPNLADRGTLFALAATARHALAGVDARLPELIIGHGILGRLLARLTIAAGGPPPTVWEINPTRMTGAQGYQVIHPDQDERKNYTSIYDASGNTDVMDQWIQCCGQGAEIVLAGFYADRINFAFPFAFMREIKLRVAAEWKQTDMAAITALVHEGHLSLDDLITHRAPAHTAAQAYIDAFENPECCKMVLDWRTLQ